MTTKELEKKVKELEKLVAKLELQINPPVPKYVMKPKGQNWWEER